MGMGYLLVLYWRLGIIMIRLLIVSGDCEPTLSEIGLGLVAQCDVVLYFEVGFGEYKLLRNKVSDLGTGEIVSHEYIEEML